MIRFFIAVVLSPKTVEVRGVEASTEVRGKQFRGKSLVSFCSENGGVIALEPRKLARNDVEKNIQPCRNRYEACAWSSQKEAVGRKVVNLWRVDCMN